MVQVVDGRVGYLHQGKPLPYLVMERLEGFTLERWLTTRGPLSAGEVLWVMRQVGRALQLAHDKGIVHRDIKPSNIFLALDEEGEPLVKLCDFGIAKLTATAAAALLQSSAGRTTAGDFLGTLLCLAPELLRGAEHATTATDQWAVGLTVFRALSGREYFAGSTSGPELVLRIAQDPLPPPSSLEPGLSPAFDSWFLRACARDPKQRYDSVERQIKALAEVLAPAEPRAVPIGAPSAHFESTFPADLGPAASEAPRSFCTAAVRGGTSIASALDCLRLLRFLGARGRSLVSAGRSSAR